MTRAIYFMFMGALGGLLAFLVSEPFAPKVIGADAEWARHQFIFGLAMGVFTGVLIGFASGQLQGSKTHAARGAMTGLVVGAIAGTLGVSLAAIIYGLMHGGSLGAGNIVPRAIGWGIFGGIVGLGEGAVRMNISRMRQGMIGGIIGGVVGGIAFEVAGNALGPLQSGIGGGNEVGTIPRAVGLVITSAAIGLFIGIVEALSRRAWVKLVLGKNEGKEWAIDGPQTIIGRSERADIPLFGDPGIAEQHAVIRKSGLNYDIVDVGTPTGIGVNGIRVPQAVLKQGDQINIGNMTLIFMMRNGGQAPVAQPADMARMQAPVQPVQLAPHQPMQPPQPIQAPQAPAGFAIVAFSGPLTGQRYSVNGSLELGRESTVVPMGGDTMASRKHARLDISPTGLMVSDLGSTNGTWANGQRVQTQLLRKGDILKIGSSEFRVE